MDFPLAERLARASVEVGSGFEGERTTAQALNAQGRFDEADAILLGLMEKASTDEERTSVALAHATSLAGAGRNADALETLVEAAARVSDDTCRQELECWRYTGIARSGRLAEALAGFTRLADDSAVSSELRAMAASWKAGALVQAGRPDDALGVIAYWEPLVRDDPDLTRPLVVMPIAVRANFWDARILALLHAGRFSQATAAANDAYDHFVPEASPLLAVFVSIDRGIVALIQGRLEAARRSFREAAALAPVADLFFRPWALALRAQAEGQAGNASGARRALDELGNSPETSYWDPDVLLGRAWAAAAEGAHTEAQRLSREAAELAEERGALAPAFTAAHDVLRLGDAEGGSARLARLAPDVQGELVVACAEHAEAVLAADAARIETAAARFAEMGALLWAAEAESEAAAAHREAGPSRALAPRRLAPRCCSSTAKARARRRSRWRGRWRTLTPREREIATLAAGGASNREIAERLVVSVRTVENTLQRAYGEARHRRTGVSSRASSGLPSTTPTANGVADYS